MRKTLAALVALTPSILFAQTFGEPLTGETVPVNTQFGIQTDPHVSGNVVAYTNEEPSSEIRYFNLATHADAAIPKSAADFDFLSDVSGQTLVFTRVTSDRSAIYAFDVTTAGAPVELDPQTGSRRRGAAVGGSTVAWQDFGLASTSGASEVVAFDRATGIASRLTDDALLDKNASVSPDGNVVVWSKCALTGTGCDIYQATRAGTSWATRPLTGLEGEDAFPDTNGAIVVYDSTRGGERDIYWQNVGGGGEGQLSLAGPQANPNVSGSLIAFEHYDASAAVPNWDLLLFDLRTQTLYRLTQTDSDETLNDIWTGADGTTHVVYSSADDVYAFTFRLAVEPPPSDCNPQPTSCASPGDRPRVGSLTLTRAAGKPWFSSQAFSADAGDGLLCVANHEATSGWITLNGRTAVGPSSFKRQVTSIEAPVTLQATNVLSAVIAGQPGSSFEVTVYGASPSACTPPPAEPDDDDCDRDDDDGHGEYHHRHHRHGHHHGSSHAHLGEGVRALKVDGRTFVVEGLTSDVATSTQAAGCSTTSGDTMAFGAFALLGLWLLSQRPQRVRAPVRWRNRK